MGGILILIVVGLLVWLGVKYQDEVNEKLKIFGEIVVGCLGIIFYIAFYIFICLIIVKIIKWMWFF